MCGIAALIGTSIACANQLTAMLDVIQHRGPDDEGWVAFANDELTPTAGGGRDTPVASYSSGMPYAPKINVNMPTGVRAALGHRRLSILDVSPAGHQPMCFEDRRFWITFNGEIYNHAALRIELAAIGHNFVSHTDTEVVLAAYAEWGESCLERLDGMFAFVIVDHIQSKVFAVRDRFGIKPLYYWIAPDRTLAFASEIKQFTVLPGWRALLNGQRTYDFLAWGILDHTDETLFKGVYQLPPGCSIGLDLKRPLTVQPLTPLPHQKWYNLTACHSAAEIDEAGQKFKQLFKTAVEAHLQADVTVGSCLSGGLDSSAIVCLVAEYLDKNSRVTGQHTFSACSNVARFDEREYIEVVVNQTSATPHYITPALDGLFDKLNDITWFQDEPFGSSSIYAQWSVFELAAKSGIKVMLDGQGADEQLAGYDGYYGALNSSLFKRFKWIELFKEMRAVKATHGRSLFWGLRYIADNLLPSGLRYRARALIGRETAVPAWLDVKRLKVTPNDPYRGGEGPAWSIYELSMRQLTRSNLQMLLHWEDRDSMAHSIEARVPFLDHRLVEYNLGLSDACKLHRGISKRVLREGLRDVLPSKIRARMSKLGFATPEEVWVREDAPEKFRSAVREAISASKGILRPEAIQFAEDIIQGHRNFDFTLWRMISFAAWIKVFDVELESKQDEK
jgi:asparagine synthase (glutamine-hydrolysing)